MTKALPIPIDKRMNEISDLPYTISFVIRKRQQIDTFNELTKEKRPPEDMIWDGTSDDIENWLDKVIGTNDYTSGISLSEDEIEQ
jgi:hypothetical protein